MTADGETAELSLGGYCHLPQPGMQEKNTGSLLLPPLGSWLPARTKVSFPLNFRSKGSFVLFCFVLKV